MSRCPIRAAFFVACTLSAFLSSTDLWAQISEPIDQPITGDTIDPALTGPSVLEAMDAVLARDALRPAFNPGRHRPAPGAWAVPPIRAVDRPHSGTRNIVNKWGDTRMGIGFGETVDLEGVWVAGQSAPAVWTSGLRVIGYRGGVEVASTPWFRQVGDAPRWFPVGLRGIDRAVFEARPVYRGGGWYALDDLEFIRTRGPGAADDLRVVLDFEDCGFGQILTDTNYAGLTWETGDGTFLDGGWDVSAPHGPARGSAGALGAIAAGRLALTQAPSSGAPGGAPDGGLPEGGSATSPVLTQQFQGVVRGDAGQNWYPPDTCGAIGPTQYVVVVNHNFAVFNRSNGATLANVALGSFMPGAVGDPRVLFDTHSNRWIVIASDFSTRVYLAVSQTSDAMGTFFKTSFVASAGSDAACFPDYPTLGLDANGIYTASYMAGSSPCAGQMTIFAIDKAPLVAPSPSLGTITAFRNLAFEGAIQPVETFGTPAVAGQYLVSRQSSTSIRVRRVSPPLTSPTLATVASVSIPSHSSPPDAPALGSTVPLDTVGHRLMNAIYRNGSIWTTHCVGVSNVASVRWYQIGEQPFQLIQSGTVDAPGLHAFFPAIAVNGLGQAVIGFSGSNANQYAACYYVGRVAQNNSGQMSSAQLLRAGAAPHNLIDSYGRNRFGDYSLTTLDPVDGTSFWTLQEYAHANNVWGTHVGKLQFDAQPDSLPPIPDPMQFDQPPAPNSQFGHISVLMSAVVASDPSGPVQYEFQETTANPGGSTSPWQQQVLFSDGGLTPNTLYTYRVRARDAMGNTTALSPAASTTTYIETPAGLVAGAVTTTTIELLAQGAFTNLADGQSGLRFDCTSPAGNGGINEWIQSTTDVAVGLQPGTTYTFRLRARNRDGVETPFVSASFATLPAPVCPLRGDVNGDMTVDGIDIAAFVRVKLGTPEPGDLPICADYETGTISGDVALFVIDLLQE